MKRSGVRTTRLEGLAAALLGAVPLLAATPPADGAALTIQDWSLATQVNTWPPGATETAASFAPTTPFQTTHFSTLDSSWSQADYDITYSSTFGSFLIESSQNALGGPFGSSAHTKAVGTLFVTADAPLAISVDASYTYALPPVTMNAQLRFVVRPLDDPEVVLFGSSQSDHSFTGEAASGILTLNDSAVLPGGLTYMIQYEMHVSTGGGPITTFGTGDGYINFTMEVLPEPATAALLICTLPLLWHRRRR